MVDIHTHILYGIDDGSQSIEESLSILAKLSRIGFTDVILTPHYIDNSEYKANNKEKKELLTNLKEEVVKHNIPINLYLGNEVFIDDDILEKIYNHEIYTLNNTSFILIELPLVEKFEYAIEVFFELRKKGVQIVLAHPERYVMIQKNVKLINEFIEIGCLLQGNIDSLSGKYGKAAVKVFTKLLKEHKYFTLASDVHHARSGYFDRFEELKREVIKLTDAAYFNELFVENPKKILADVQIDD